MTRIVRTLAVALLLVAAARSTHAQRNRRGATARFDYYLLTLSWAPDFCAASGGYKDPAECGAGRHIGFIVHGLWPQNNAGRGPENCGGSARVPSSVVTATASYIPTASLIQHEWTTHGTCSGLGVDAYFAALRSARDGVRIPPELATLSKTLVESPADVQRQFAAANPTISPTAIRATCTGGTLQEVRVCLDRAFKPRTCTQSAGGCTVPRIRILPVR